MRHPGDIGRCEAVDLVPTEDDAIFVPCPHSGRVIYEKLALGGLRLRCVCKKHGLDTAPTWSKTGEGLP